MYRRKEIVPAKSVQNVINSAVHHLEHYGPHSVAMLRKKIERKTDNQEWIEQALEHCARYWGLNDRNYAEMFIRSSANSKGRGPNRIRQELRMKGVADNIISEELEALDFDFYESALKRMNTKFKSPITTPKERDKATRHLVGRGFDFDMVKYALSEHLKEPEEY